MLSHLGGFPIDFSVTFTLKQSIPILGCVGIHLCFLPLCSPNALIPLPVDHPTISERLGGGGADTILDPSSEGAAAAGAEGRR